MRYMYVYVYTYISVIECRSGVRKALNSIPSTVLRKLITDVCVCYFSAKHCDQVRETGFLCCAFRVLWKGRHNSKALVTVVTTKKQCPALTGSLLSPVPPAQLRRTMLRSGFLCTETLPPGESSRLRRLVCINKLLKRRGASVCTFI